MESVSSISSLHEDIYWEILIRLDPRSLCRFKTVSKSWYQFLSQPSFSKHYSKIRPSITGFFYRASIQYPEKLQYVPISRHEENIIDPPSCLGFLDFPAILKNTCNGLMHWSVSSDKHFISNPLTNKSVTIPWPFYDSKEMFACGIAFDPSISEHFKVLVLLDQREYFTSRAFSSEKMDWGIEIIIEIEIGALVPPYCSFKGVFFNGVLYWELRTNQLLAYHLNKHTVCLIELPVMENSAKDLGINEPGCLGESGGRLHYCRVFGTELYVWEANQETLVNSATWVCKALVNLCDLRHENPSRKHYGSQAFAFLHDCQGILSGMKKKILMHESPSRKILCSRALAFLNDCRGILLSMNKKIVVYYFWDMAVQEVGDARRNGETMDYVQPSMFFPFVQSLALFNFPCRS